MVEKNPKIEKWQEKLYAIYNNDLTIKPALGFTGQTIIHWRDGEPMKYEERRVKNIK